MVKFLGTKTGALAALVLALIAQLPHATEVFMGSGNMHKLSGAWWWAGLAHGIAYALALELAVLIFVVQKQKAASYIFAGVSVLINLCYYAEQGDLFALSAFSDWLISFALPIAIALYSHAVAKDDDTQDVDVRAWLRSAWRKVRATVRVADNAPDNAPHIADDTVATMQGDMQPDKRTRALQLHDEGFKPAHIASEVDAPVSTVQSWIRRQGAKLNGAHTKG